jgi:GNAT superfamily N-acetyltransferase
VPEVPHVEVRPGVITSSVADALIRALNEELSARYPEPGANHFRLDEEEVAEGQGAFLVAYAGTTPVGCGAIRRLDLETAEIKRMYVDRFHRGQGIGRLVLTRLEDEAHALGVGKIVLETGVRQPEAIALYSRAGFSEIPAFGEYLDSSLSVCMAKEL